MCRSRMPVRWRIHSFARVDELLEIGVREGSRRNERGESPAIMTGLSADAGGRGFADAITKDDPSRAPSAEIFVRRRVAMRPRGVR